MFEEIEKSLGIHGRNDSGVWLQSTRSLRQLIGILGVLLPFLLFLFSLGCENQPLESISHYYYTTSSSILVSILSLVGVFLILYTKDFMLSSVAGIAAFCIAFFPTNSLEDSCNVLLIQDHTLRIHIHYISAAIFLSLLTYMVFCFMKLDMEEKKIQHKLSYKWLYFCSGIFMTFSLLVLGIRFLLEQFPNNFKDFIEFYESYKLTFWMEVLALEAFGFAWLLKGRETLTNKTL